MASNITHSTQGSSLADILEKILDKGIVIAGDVSIALADVELLTIKIRLVVASVEKAMEMGIDWWKDDPVLCSSAKNTEQLNEPVYSSENDNPQNLNEPVPPVPPNYENSNKSAPSVPPNHKKSSDPELVDSTQPNNMKKERSSNRLGNITI